MKETMWGAAPRLSRHILPVFLAGSIVALTAAPAQALIGRDSSGLHANLPQKLWALEVDHSNIRLFGKGVAQRARRARANTLLVDGRRLSKGEWSRVHQLQRR